MKPGAAVSLEIARRRRLTRDNGIPGHDNPPVRAGRAGTEFFIKIYFWTGTRRCTLGFQAAHDTPIFKK